MKTILNHLYTGVLILALLFTCDANAHAGQKNKKAKRRKTEVIKLFNGKDLAGWIFFLKDPSVDPASVFTVKEGVISIKGDPFGYMRTTDSFSDYRLHVEWRWPVEPTNSGVFVHAQTPDNIWIKCIECQLAAGNAGDFICMNGTDMNERTDKSSIVVKKKAQSSEKPAGEWNTMEVACYALLSLCQWCTSEQRHRCERKRWAYLPPERRQRDTVQECLAFTRKEKIKNPYPPGS